MRRAGPRRQELQHAAADAGKRRIDLGTRQRIERYIDDLVRGLGPIADEKGGGRLLLTRQECRVPFASQLRGVVGESFLIVPGDSPRLVGDSPRLVNTIISSAVLIDLGI